MSQASKPKPPKKPKNLITMADRSPEERREISRRGGKASGEARKKRKALREALDELLRQPVSQRSDKEKESAEKVAGILGKNPKDVTTQDALLASVVTGVMKASMSGDLRAFEVLRDTLGEKPATKLEHSGTLTTAEVHEYRMPENGRN